MIDLLSGGPDHLIALRLSGRLEGGDFDRFAKRLDEVLGEREQVNLFMEIAPLEGVSPKALLKDVQMGLSQIKNLRRLHRVAVVSDNAWIRTGTAWENRLFSTSKLRAFEPQEREEALAWASEAPPEAGPPKRGLEEIPTSNPSVLAFALTGPVTGADIEQLAPRLTRAYGEHGSVNLLMRLGGTYRFRLDVLSGQLTQLKTDALAHVERYAVVGAPVWTQSAAGLVAPLLKLDLHFFEREDEAAAWDWVGAQPAAARLPEHKET